MEVLSGQIYKPTEGSGMTLPDDVSIIPEPSEEYLNQRQYHDYAAHRESFLEWLAAFGKNPGKAEGYAAATVKNTAYRTDKFYRWVWDRHGGYTTNITHDHADDYLRYLATETEYSNSHCAKEMKALKRLFKWHKHERGGELWDPILTFNDGGTSTQPRDYLTETERKQIREAALEYGSIPAYSTVTPRERARWEAYLAQRFSKSKDEVEREDWERANGWKIPSLTWTSLDAGLRPAEVERATVDWVDIENGVLRVPKEDSTKNQDNWIVGLRDQTVSALDRWLDEREAYAMYDDVDTLWLTREANPYGSHSLRYVLNRLCEIAGIDTEHRSMTWYSVRHSVGTYMTRERDLAAAKAQLRHQSPKTTMRYDQVPVEDRKDALEKMG